MTLAKLAEAVVIPVSVIVPAVAPLKVTVMTWSEPLSAPVWVARFVPLPCTE